jgi:hypothetical protein
MTNEANDPQFLLSPPLTPLGLFGRLHIGRSHLGRSRLVRHGRDLRTVGCVLPPRTHGHERDPSKKKTNTSSKMKTSSAATPIPSETAMIRRPTDASHTSGGPTNLRATVQREVGGARTGVDENEADWRRTPTEQKNVPERSSASGKTRAVRAPVWNWTQRAATLNRVPSREAPASAGSRIAQTDCSATALAAELPPPVAAPVANAYVCVALPMTLKARTRLARDLRNRTAISKHSSPNHTRADIGVARNVPDMSRAHTFDGITLRECNS